MATVLLIHLGRAVSCLPQVGATAPGRPQMIATLDRLRDTLEVSAAGSA